MYPQFRNKKVVVYAPTFRKNRDISKEIDLLAQQFDKEQYIFVLKKHPHMEVKCEDVFIENNFTKCYNLFALGCGQAVRLSALTRRFVGSNPTTPANNESVRTN